MYSFSGPTSYPEFDLGSPSTSGHLQRAPLSNSSWETRCLRKHRRRVDDEGCSAKRRRLMFEAEVDISENSNTSSHHDWPSAPSRPPLPAQPSSSAPPQPCPAPHSPQPSSTLPRPDPESSCMEIEAAQRRLQEIEDSLKEGLQRGISDILPHTVAQSVSQSCMELVLWRPPEDPFCRKRKVSLQKQHKKQTVSRLPPTPCPSTTPRPPLSPSSPPAETHSALYSFPVALTSGEEDMEM
ncbi:Coiled-coil domain containing protein 117 [Dissostichus eleginoides]|uniref:Coiled-coil domain containing protein 117 n=1 Tax=Dissostichus eleginoides TaxID=100907 RepID=A0AAD9F7N9_DISEL|nr:Coiled-coil domain containing protein 117 [Dissostichus eleginoides]